MIRFTKAGFFCEPGGFYIDPWQVVRRAVVTHAHSDHLRRGSNAYLVVRESEALCRMRLQRGAVVQTAAYGEPVMINGVKVSFHPAGHILGSAQVRMEYQGQVTVISGDYKRQPDPTCAPFEPVPCHTFITEATFGLPIYRWRPVNEVFADINAWWRANQEAGKASVILGYSLGKAQHLLAGVESSIGPIFTSEPVEAVNQVYRKMGIRLPATTPLVSAAKSDLSQALIIAPPATSFSTDYATAFASGWMQIRGRRGSIDRGFVLSDHVDWPDLINTIRETGASRIGVTHGYVSAVVRWLREQGYQAEGFDSHYIGGDSE